MPLTPEQIQRLDRLLDGALDLGPDEQRAWLGSLGPENADLVGVLHEGLFGAAPLDLTPLDVTATQILQRETGELHRAGERIGPYVLVRMLGQGGLAQVWLANRDEGVLRRDVALKVPNLRMRRPELASRFTRECEILQKLEHEHIARLYDAGVDQSGIPWLVMEYIAGEKFTDWCDNRCAPLNQRIGLFLQVLDAVQFAHDKGVLHLDIKASNVMVSERGVVRLLDFGVARMFGPDSPPESAAFALALTPQYASPEQVLGRDVGPASDIFSLGALLFELLAGRLPPAVTAAAAPVLPSACLTTESATRRGASLQRIRSEMEGELDAIVGKAIAHDPAARYASAADFRDDLLRFLEGRSVAALPRSAFARGARRLRRRPLAVSAAALVLAILTFGSVTLVRQAQEREFARGVLLPKLEQVAERREAVPDTAVLDQAMELGRILPGDPAAKKAIASVTSTLTIESDPPGAEIFWKPYVHPQVPWRSAGTSPVRDVRVTASAIRVEVRRPNYQTVELLSPAIDGATAHRVKLDPVGSLPEGMVRIPAAHSGVDLNGLETLEEKDVPEFFIDRYEVTNLEFQRFVDAGGYRDTSYWRFPIRDHGRTLPLDTALQRFVDRTGKPGPSTWEAGTYPVGQAAHPVTGVSWYEAAAYAQFVHKQLPTLYHWSQVADNAKASRVIPLSNFGGKGTAPVGSNAGFSSRGVYDLAGNAREWIFNETSTDGQRFILGGGWPDSPKMFVDSYTQPPMDRSPSNGFRCVLAADRGAVPADLQLAVRPSFRDYARETPVDERTFAAYLRHFDYERKPLHARLERANPGAYWKHEVVAVDAGYGAETMRIHLFLPANASANTPLQPVIFYPGSDALLEDSVDEDSEMRFVGFLVKSGRVVVLPVYKSTFERQDEVKSPWPGEPVQYRDHLVMWVKDVRRTIDYLATRPDMAADRVAYFGFSWGGALGATIPAVEPRIKVVVLDGAGFLMQRYLPEVDPLNFAPRVRQPVLVLSGKYDAIFPLENSLQPMVRAFGTPAAKKKLVLFESGHIVPYTGMVRETLSWLDANSSAKPGGD